jgi:hypothetical protein
MNITQVNHEDEPPIVPTEAFRLGWRSSTPVAMAGAQSPSLDRKPDTTGDNDEAEQVAMDLLGL